MDIDQFGHSLFSMPISRFKNLVSLSIESGSYLLNDTFLDIIINNQSLENFDFRVRNQYLYPKLWDSYDISKVLLGITSHQSLVRLTLILDIKVSTNSNLLEPIIGYLNSNKTLQYLYCNFSVYPKSNHKINNSTLTSLNVQSDFLRFWDSKNTSMQELSIDFDSNLSYNDDSVTRLYTMFPNLTKLLLNEGSSAVQYWILAATKVALTKCTQLKSIKFKLFNDDILYNSLQLAENLVSLEIINIATLGAIKPEFFKTILLCPNLRHLGLHSIPFYEHLMEAIISNQTLVSLKLNIQSWQSPIRFLSTLFSTNTTLQYLSYSVSHHKYVGGRDLTYIPKLLEAIEKSNHINSLKIDFMVKMSLNKKVVVTGASGYIGSSLVKRLLDIGNINVVAVVRDKSNQIKNQFLLEIEGAKERLTLESGDLETADYSTIFKDAYAIMHIASPYIYRADDPQKDIVQPAIQGNLRVLEAATKHSSIKKVIITSSSAAVIDLQKKKAVYNEDDWNDSSNISNPYTYSKYLAEKAAWDFKSKNPQVQYQVIILNPAFVLGPPLVSSYGQSLNTSLTTFRDSVIGKGDPLFSSRLVGVIDIRDLIKALEKALVSSENYDHQRYIMAASVITFHDMGVLCQQLFPQYKFTPTPIDPSVVLHPHSIESKSPLKLDSYIDIKTTLKDCIQYLLDSKNITLESQ
ncbi:NAD-dependent epimerase/dehydratase family protein [Tieghemostelium lacteum]|uniref:NAD-dependent epimerase/dehydratase family protein n=1 Tax=Tieghemostelium lacteum TaxID=361077 RepID=A0A151Z965_TIELA|nr:NAD-dependent epimerase/dehydratase family protein [Tieghemostelium lacteum]|eukprot:KYQ90487.1 NAD-dependent epimerase/dehydratase family protein [Tieghemostelium lacteum]